MKKFLKQLQLIEDGILIFTFAVMVISFFMQVVNRNIIKGGFSWFEELSTFCMLYMAFLAAEAGLRDGTQISVTALTDRLQGKTKLFVQLIAKAIVVIFAAVIFYTSIGILKMQFLSGQTSPALQIPMTVPYFAITLSFGITVVVQSAIFIGMLVQLFRGAQGDRGTKEVV